VNIRKVLLALFKEIVSEADANPEFRARLEAAMDLPARTNARPAGKAAQKRPIGGTSQPKRPGNRRAPAVLDPVSLAKHGDEVLRAELSSLTIEQLRDIVAEYGMDTSKLVLKWRDPERVVDRIVEVARGRAQKGSAFREQVAPDELTIERPEDDQQGRF
jgi:hypothetical protein